MGHGSESDKPHHILLLDSGNLLIIGFTAGTKFNQTVRFHFELMLAYLMSLENSWLIS